jgi:hypothetical protein
MAPVGQARTGLDGPLGDLVTGRAPPPPSGGHRVVASNGGLSVFGDATSASSMAGKPLNAPIVGMAVTPLA